MSLPAENDNKSISSSGNNKFFRIEIMNKNALYSLSSSDSEEEFSASRLTSQSKYGSEIGNRSITRQLFYDSECNWSSDPDKSSANVTLL